VQLPLSKGDALFFNPALFHAGGSNQSANVQRMVNLLQISSAFGRAMEAVDRDAMVRHAYGALRAAATHMSADDLAAAVAATAEGYSFPTNLDTDPPIGGNAPQTQADILWRALHEGWAQQQLDAMLDALNARQRP
jgi:ectoine hydroxylase-related dioxygenase (phytanoyl-CoA dioxygenase family)